MTWSTIYARETDAPLISKALHRRGFFAATCDASVSWFKWCPLDVALWILLLCILVLICWKVYITNRVGPNSPGQRKTSTRERHCRVEFPQPEELTPPPPQYCTYGYKVESGQAHDTPQYDDCLNSSPILQRSDSIAPTPDGVKANVKHAKIGLGIDFIAQNLPGKRGFLGARGDLEGSSMDGDRKTAIPESGQTHVPGSHP